LKKAPRERLVAVDGRQGCAQPHGPLDCYRQGEVERATGGDIRVLTTADDQSILELIRELYECESPLALCRHAKQRLA